MPTADENLAIAEQLARGVISHDPVEQETTWKILRSKRTYKNWQEPLQRLVPLLLDHFGSEGAKGAQHWLRTLAEQRASPQGDPGYLGLALALRSLRDVSSLAIWQEQGGPQLEREIIDTWLQALLTSAIYQSMAQPAPLATLAYDIVHCAPLAVKYAVDRLLGILLQVRYQHLQPTIVHALTMLRDAIPLEPLLAALQQEPGTVRIGVVKVLGALGDRAPIEALIATLEGRLYAGPLVDNFHHPEWRVQECVVEVLAQLGDRVPIEPFLYAQLHGGMFVEEAATRALSMRTHIHPTEFLLHALASDSWKTRAAAVRGLRLVEREHAPVEQLIEALRDSNVHVAAAAVGTLAALGDPSLIESLLAVFDTSDWWVQLAIIQTLDQFGHPVPLELLLSTLERPEIAMRAAAVRALGKLGDRAPLDVIQSALNDWQAEVRTAAILALGAQEERWPASLFVQALHDPDYAVRMAAARVLDARGTREERRALLPLLRDQDPRVRRDVADIIKTRGQEAIEDALAFAQEEAIRNMRIAAIQVLGAVEDPAVVAALLAVVQDPDGAIRAEAAKALGTLGEGGQPIPLEPLLNLLHDAEEQVRSSAIQALGKLFKLHQPIDALMSEMLRRDEPRIQRVLALVSRPEVSVEQLLDVLLAGLQDHPTTVPVPLVIDPRKQLLADRLLTDWHIAVRSIPARILAKLARYIRDQLSPDIVGEQAEEFVTYEWLLQAVVAKAERTPGKGAAVKLLITLLHDDLAFELYRRNLNTEPLHPIETLRAVLSDSKQESEERCRALYRLGQWKEQAPLEPMVAALKDPGWEIRRSALSALQMCGARVPLAVFLSALDDDMSPVRVAAMRALAERAAEVPIEVFVQASRDTASELEAAQEWELDLEECLRVFAVQALGSLREQAPLEPLLAALDDRDERVRRAAMQALGRMEARISLEPLIASLGDVTLEVIDALKQQGSLGRKIPADPLLMALGNSEKQVRQAAAAALWYLHPVEFLRLLPEIQATVLGQQRSTLFASLLQEQRADTCGEIGDTSLTGIETLTELLNWPYWKVRLKAVQALHKVHRPVPEATLRSLLELRHDPQSRAVRKAVDSLLDDLLSLETCLEDG